MQIKKKRIKKELNERNHAYHTGSVWWLAIYFQFVADCTYNEFFDANLFFLFFSIIKVNGTGRKLVGKRERNRFVFALYIFISIAKQINNFSQERNSTKKKELKNIYDLNI